MHTLYPNAHVRTLLSLPCTKRCLFCCKACRRHIYYSIEIDKLPDKLSAIAFPPHVCQRAGLYFFFTLHLIYHLHNRLLSCHILQAQDICITLSPSSPMANIPLPATANDIVRDTDSQPRACLRGTLPRFTPFTKERETQI